MSARQASNEDLTTDYARWWLILATAAVAASALFAILIVMARVPALGTLFPGNTFYRVALTLHVDLSQWVWFMAFASMLWSLTSRYAPGRWSWLALILGTSGSLLIALSPILGAVTPIMSNYVPVLDSRFFLLGLGLYAGAVLIMAIRAVGEGLTKGCAKGDPLRWGLFLAAVVILIALLLLASTHLAINEHLTGHAYFETLFWGAGHIWQFCLVLLMQCAWLSMVPPNLRIAAPRTLIWLLGLTALPVLAAPLLRLWMNPLNPDYANAFTWLMQWTSWEMPLLLGIMILLALRQHQMVPAPGFTLALVLLGAGIVLGSRITGQTTLVTAHYHGTIGAVTVSFMGLTHILLPRFGMMSPPHSATRLQLGLYGYGILLMMTGLAGAGLMGAPRKTAGNVGLEFSVETLSRLVMGVGGTLATAGILLFLFLVLRQLLPGAAFRFSGHD